MTKNHILHNLLAAPSGPLLVAELLVLELRCPKLGYATAYPLQVFRVNAITKYIAADCPYKHEMPI